MSTVGTTLARNQALAEQINEDARRNPHSPYRGKFVGLANGQLIQASHDLESVLAELRRVEPDPSNCFCFEAGLDYRRTDEIWGVH